MIIPAQTLRKIQPIQPFVERQVYKGMSYGVGPAGYDVRVKLEQDLHLLPGAFTLSSTIEEFNMPNDVLGEVKDKSSWARLGLCVQNTVIEPGWRGFLTLELTNHHGERTIKLENGMPIAQIIFYRLEEATEKPYKGKYQNQEDRPVETIFEF